MCVWSYLHAPAAVRCSQPGDPGSLSGLPVKGIKVSVAAREQYTNTDENGKFSFYVDKLKIAKMKFSDVDSTQNIWFSNKDTLITIDETVLSAKESKVFLNIQLENK